MVYRAEQEDERNRFRRVVDLQDHKKKEENIVSDPYFVQSVSSMQMSSISQMMLGRKHACYKSLSGRELAVCQLMEYYSILFVARSLLQSRDVSRDQISSLFAKTEHMFIPKDACIVEANQPDVLFLHRSLLTNRALVSSGQVLIQEEGKEDIVWETQSFSSYLTSWEFLLFLVNPEHTSVRALLLPEP